VVQLVRYMSADSRLGEKKKAPHGGYLLGVYLGTYRPRYSLQGQQRMAGLKSDSTAQHDVHRDRVWVRLGTYRTVLEPSLHQHAPLPLPPSLETGPGPGVQQSREGAGRGRRWVFDVYFAAAPPRRPLRPRPCSAVWPRVRRLCSLCPAPGWDLASPPALAPPIPIYRPAASLRRCVAAHCPLPAARCPPPTPTA
jgi:hypothetical protein